MTPLVTPDTDHHIGVSKAIIDKFGGPTELSRELARIGLKANQPTIRQWTLSTIPERWRPILIRLAAKEGIDHTPEDYIAHLRPFAE